MATIDLSKVKGAGYFYTVSDEAEATWQAENSTDTVPSGASTVGTVSLENGTYIYDASSSSVAQQILGAGGTSSWVIYGSDGADEITTQKGSGTTFIDGRGGDDTIDISASTSSRDVVVFGSTSGADTVYGFDNENDILFFSDGFSGASATLSNGNVVLRQNGATITAVGSYKTGDTFRIADSEDNIIAVTVASSGGTVAAKDVSPTAIYSGVDGAVDFSNANNDVVIDLGNTGNYGDGPSFQGIVAATGADKATNIIVGAAETRNTLQGGSASDNSLYGGGTAADLLIGGSKAEDVFFYGEGDGSDSVANFTFGEDLLYLASGQMESYTRDGNNVVLRWSGDGSGKKLTLVGGTNSTYTYTTGDGTSRNISFSTKGFSYSDSVNDYFYVGAGKGTVSVSGNDDAKLWLDGSRGASFSGVSVLNAKNSTGSLELAGGNSGDSIVGGKGSNSLWGGAAGNDTIAGGKGDNEFYFGYNEGKDVITSYNDGDKVMLYNFNVGNVTSAGIDGKDMVIKFNDGSKLTVSNYATKGDMSFQLTDGTFTYDKSSGSWNQA